MKRKNLLALVMAVVMLMPVLTSCKLNGKGGNNVVKASDPWYETTRFELVKDIKTTEKIAKTKLCASNEKLFYIYCLRDAGWTYRTILDTYDDDGNLVKRKKLSCPSLDDFVIRDLYYAIADPDGKTIKTIIYMSYGDKYGPAFADIDPETGIVSNVKELYSERVKKVKKADAGILNVIGAGDYAVAVCDSSNGPGRIEYQLLLYKDSEFVTSD